MADVVPGDGPAPSTGGPIATAVSPGARSGRFTAASWLAASPPQPGDGYLRRDERHGAAGLPNTLAAHLRAHSFLPTSGPVIRCSSGRVEAMIPSDATRPARTMR